MGVNILNNVGVYVQDQTSEILNLYLCDLKNTTTPVQGYELGVKVIVVTSATGAAVGDCINIIDNGRMFQSIIKNVTGTTITFASPTDMVITASAKVCFGEWDLAQANGSVTPVTYKIQPPAGVKWDITKVNFSITDASDMDDGLFGGITALTNGIIFRGVDGFTKQFALISNNAGFREYGFDVDYNEKAPSGQYGYSGSINIRNHGVVIRLDGDTEDTLEVIVNDNLTGLLKFAIVAQGHVVED